MEIILAASDTNCCIFNQGPCHIHKMNHFKKEIIMAASVTIVAFLIEALAIHYIQKQQMPSGSPHSSEDMKWWWMMTMS